MHTSSGKLSCNNVGVTAVTIDRLDERERRAWRAADQQEQLLGVEEGIRLLALRSDAEVVRLPALVLHSQIKSKAGSQTLSG